MVEDGPCSKKPLFSLPRVGSIACTTMPAEKSLSQCAFLVLSRLKYGELEFKMVWG